MAYRRAETFQPPGLNSGQTAKYGALAEELQNFNSLVEQVGTPIVADIGAQRGAVEGNAKTGGIRVPIGAYNRAYNNAYLNAYALDIYADTAEDFARLENEAAGNPDVFRTMAQARRSAILAETDPSVAPAITKAIDIRIAEGQHRLGVQKAANDRTEMKLKTLRGLDQMGKDISRYLTSGTQAGLDQADALGKSFVESVNMAQQALLLAPEEADQLINNHIRDNAMNIMLGEFEAARNDPVGDPVALIERTLTDDNPLFSDEDRQRLAGEMRRRLAEGRELSRLADEDERMAQQQRWDDNGVAVTLAYGLGHWPNGKPFLMTDIPSQDIDPDMKTQLIKLMKPNGGGAGDDPAALRQANQYIADIYANPLDAENRMAEARRGIAALTGRGLSSETAVRLYQQVVASDSRQYSDPEFGRYSALLRQRITGVAGEDLTGFVGIFGQQKAKQLQELSGEAQEALVSAHHAMGPTFNIAEWYDMALPHFLERAKQIRSGPDESTGFARPVFNVNGDPTSGINWKETVSVVKDFYDKGQYGVGPEAAKKAAAELRAMGYNENAEAALKAQGVR